MSTQSLGTAIRTRRLQLGWTQEQLAERVSAQGEYVRQSEISRLETGRVQLPRYQRLARIAAALDLSTGELLARSGWADADLYLQEQATSAPAQWAGKQPVSAESADGADTVAGIDAGVRDIRVAGSWERPESPAAMPVALRSSASSGIIRRLTSDDRARHDALRNALDELHREAHRLMKNRAIAEELGQRLIQCAVSRRYYDGDSLPT